MTAAEHERLYDLEARDFGGEVIVAQFSFARGQAVPHAEAACQMSRAAVPQLVVFAAADARRAFAGLRLTLTHVEAFFHVGQAENAARVITATAARWPGLPVPWMARRVGATKVWISLAPQPGDIGDLAADDPTLEEIEARLAALDDLGARFEQLKRHLASVKVRHEQIQEEASIALSDPMSTLAAQAWVAEQLEAIGNEIAALTSALPK